MLLFCLSRLVLELVFGKIFRVRVHGLENIPRRGAAILAINHASYFDAPVVGSQIGKVRPFRSIGKRELFKVPLLGAYLRAMGAIPLDRDRSDPAALRAALDALAQGELFLMAPEGTRGVSGRPRTPKPGVAFLAHRSGAPVIPVRIHGTKGWPVPGRLWIRFGRPIRLRPGAAAPDALSREYRRWAVELMARIYAMTEDGES